MAPDDTLQEIASLRHDPPPIRYIPLAATLVAMVAITGWVYWGLMAEEKYPTEHLVNQIILGSYLSLFALVIGVVAFNWISDRQGRRMCNHLNLLASEIQADLAKKRKSVH